MRVVAAWVCAAAATAYASAGCIEPAWVGFGMRRGVFCMAALPLAAAAILHVYLVSMGTRRVVEERGRAESASE